MLIRIFKGIVHLSGGLAAGLVMATLVMAWVLSQGPISLSFMAPHVSDYLRTVFPHVQAEFDDTLLTWAGWKRVVNLRVVNLRLRAKEDTIVARIPEITVSLSTKGLLQGIIAPSKLEMSGPTLHLVRPVEGNVNLAFAGIGAMMSGRLKPVLSALSEKPDPASPLSFLEEIVVSDADLIVEDSISSRSWVTPDIQIMVRRSGGQIDVETSFLVDMDKTVAEVSIVAGYDSAIKRIDAGISFSRIMPAVLSQLAEEMDFLRYAEIPMQGTITLAASVEGVLESIGVNLTGGSGKLHLPAPLSGSLNTNNLVFNGYYDAPAGRFNVDQFLVELAENQQITIPDPVSHSYPVRDISFAGSYDGPQKRIEINNLDLNLGGLPVHLNGIIDNVTDLPSMAVTINIPELSVPEVPLYWPSSLANDVYKWVTSHVLSGVIRNLYAEIEGAMTQDGNFQTSRIDGGFTIHDSAYLYLKEMPPISDIEAIANFNQDQFDIAISSSRSHGLNIDSGSIALSGLSGDQKKVEVRALVSGSSRDVMDLIDQEPLAFAADLGIDPETVEGEAKVELAFDFPLKESLEWEEVVFSADATAQNINIPDGLFDLDVDDGMLNIFIDNAGMDVSGEMLLNNFSTVLSWRQNFKEDAPYSNHYELTMHLTDVKSFTDLGIDVRPFSAEMIAGDIPLNLKVTQYFTGPTKLEATASLDELSVFVPAINWYKRIGVPGQAQAVFSIENDAVIEIPEFQLRTDALEIVGSAHYSEAGGQLDNIELSRIAYGRTELSGVLYPGEFGVWDADFNGPSLDLAPVWEDMIFGDMLETGESVLENISVSTQFDRVWLSNDQFVENMTGAFVRADEKWRTVYITANVEGGAPLGIKLSPSKTQNKRIFTAWSSDAGTTLRTFDVYNTMLGGSFSLNGHIDDEDEESPLYGFFDVQDYRIIKAPVLAKMVSIMSLTGIVDALKGDGLGFSNLHIPFRYANGILELRDAKATGASLGFTAAGKLYTTTNVIDVTGTMVPVYAINSLLGNIPLIGNIFTGGEEGSGIFAADYYMSGAIDDPDISVNPLSMLTPGFLRNIFDVFETDKPPESVEPEN